MISQDTLRTVIEIVPEDEWRIIESDVHHLATGQWFLRCELPQWALDALAAAAVRVVDEMPGYTFLSRAGKTSTIWPAESVLPEIRIEGPNRTENTLLAIAEFVRSGGFESE